MLFFITASNVKNMYKTQADAQAFFDKVCASGSGHVYMYQELPFKVLCERNPV